MTAGASEPSGKPKRSLISILSHGLMGFSIGVIGLIASPASSYYFYNKGLSDAVTEAKAKGENLGRAEGQKQGLAAFEVNVPKLIEERYPGAVQNAQSLGFARGRRRGKPTAKKKAKRSVARPGALKEKKRVSQKVRFKDAKRGFKRAARLRWQSAIQRVAQKTTGITMLTLFLKLLREQKH